MDASTIGIRPAVGGPASAASHAQVGAERARAPRRRANVKWKQDEPVEVIEVCCSPDSVMARGAAVPPVLHLPEALHPDRSTWGLLSTVAQSSTCAIGFGLCVGLVLVEVLNGGLGVAIGLVIFLVNTRMLLKAAPPSVLAKFRPK